MRPLFIIISLVVLSVIVSAVVFLVRWLTGDSETETPVPTATPIPSPVVSSVPVSTTAPALTVTNTTAPASANTTAPASVNTTSPASVNTTAPASSNTTAPAGSKMGVMAANTPVPMEPYTFLGCFKDGEPRTLLQTDGMDPRVSDDYKQRSDAVNKCYMAAKDRKHKYFGLQDGGWCASGDASAQYDKYGTSDKCSNGKGGSWASSVYMIN